MYGYGTLEAVGVLRWILITTTARYKRYLQHILQWINVYLPCTTLHIPPIWLHRNPTPLLGQSARQCQPFLTPSRSREWPATRESACLHRTSLSYTMSGVATKAAPELAKYRKYAHHLTTESTWTTAAREVKYMCASLQPIACHKSHSTVVCLLRTKGLLLDFQVAVLGGLRGDWRHLSQNRPRSNWYGETLIWSALSLVTSLRWSMTEPRVRWWYQMRT